MVFGLLAEGVAKIVIVNRTKEKADSIAERFGEKVIAGNWSDKESYLASADLLVNTTILGMVGKPELTINLTSLPKSAIATDIVYSPLMTDLLVAAQQQGNIVVDGIGMLLHQAVPGFEYWFGKKPEVTDELASIILQK